MLGLDIAYQYTKFDKSSFSSSRDMVGALKNLNGSRNLATPLSEIFVIRGLALATINLSTNLKFLSPPTTKI